MNGMRSSNFRRFASAIGVIALCGIGSPAFGQDPDIKTLDGSNSFTRVSGWAERRFTSGGPWSWFWNAGLGVASVNADVVAGPTISGGTFHLEHHLTDYKITDTVSGTTGKIGAHSPIGASVTLSYRF